MMIVKVVIEGEDILQLIPQRAPMVMIDRFEGSNGDTSCGGLLVSSDNIFFEEAHLQPAGVIEHIAQVAAARIGYLYTYIKNEPVPLGFIGSVDKMTIHRLPTSGQYVHTEITIIQQVGDITLIAATAKCNEQLVVECRMKIFLKTEEERG